jgi:hypothetical protein
MFPPWRDFGWDGPGCGRRDRGCERSAGLKDELTAIQQ